MKGQALRLKEREREREREKQRERERRLVQCHLEGRPRVTPRDYVSGLSDFDFCPLTRSLSSRDTRITAGSVPCFGQDIHE